jgi:hypothetical protein
MADSEDFAGCIGAVLMIALVVSAVMIAVMTLMSLGAVFGAGTALHNYGLAFAGNVKPQRVNP